MIDANAGSRSGTTDCGGGISATVALFQLHRLGYANLALYDASMSEWASDPSLPIERDPAEAD